MRVNEIFYSIQGEGAHTGVPAVFVRLSGCNLRCPFCDTDFNSGEEMTPEAIAAAVNAYPARHVIITGGEPTLQLDVRLCSLLKNNGKIIHLETNGSLELPADVSAMIDWITCSPKGVPVKLRKINEVKVVFGSALALDPADFIPLVETHGAVASLQPCDTGDAVENRRVLDAALEYIMQHPVWRLSLQTHKLINVR